MMFRDAVLEGANAAEVEALRRLCSEPSLHLDPILIRRMEAKGWIENHGEACLLTIPGRTLVDARGIQRIA